MTAAGRRVQDRTGLAAGRVLSSLCRRVSAFRSRRPHLFTFAAVCLATALAVAFVDRPVALYFAEDADPETVITFDTLSDLGKATWYVVVLCTVLVGLAAASLAALRVDTAERLQRWKRACVFILLSLAASGAVLHTLKFVIGRFRPRALLQDGIYGLDPFTFGYLNSSFPSGHSQTMGALAAALILVYPRYDLAYLLIAATVWMSRVVTTDHFVSDVIFGAYLGIAAAILIKAFYYDRRGLDLHLTLARDRRLAGGSRPPRRQRDP